MNTKRKIIPLGDRVLVRTTSLWPGHESADSETKTKSGIIIPETVNKERPEEGVVVAVGEGRTNDEGKVISPKVKVGDMIIFSKYGPDEIKLDGEEFYILNEANILAIIK